MRGLIICICLLIMSCHSIDRPKKPKNLISKDKMVEVIIDMSLLLSAKGTNKMILEARGVLPQDYVYKKHNIDSVQFALSNEYYAFDIDEYETIYTKVNDSLAVLKKVYKKLEDEELKAKRKRDSVKRATKMLDTTKIDRKTNKTKRPRPQFTKPLSKKPDTLR